MMKALLIVSALGGGIDGGYEVEMPSMTECLDATWAYYYWSNVLSYMTRKGERGE